MGADKREVERMEAWWKDLGEDERLLLFDLMKNSSVSLLDEKLRSADGLEDDASLLEEVLSAAACNRDKIIDEIERLRAIDDLWSEIEKALKLTSLQTTLLRNSADRERLFLKCFGESVRS
jgi:hypothetical protein